MRFEELHDDDHDDEWATALIRAIEADDDEAARKGAPKSVPIPPRPPRPVTIDAPIHLPRRRSVTTEAPPSRAAAAPVVRARTLAVSPPRAVRPPVVIPPLATSPRQT